MKNILIAIAAFFITVSAFAQMQFTKTTHDFGQISETGGEAVYKFEFTNTGKTPVIITDVKSSCGCTTPEWTKQPVLPGKAGFVKAIFDPKDRPGIFDKEITVSTKAEQVKLKISGEVLPKTKGTADLYPRKVGDLRLKSANLPFANIYNTDVVTDSLPIINTGKTNMLIGFAKTPSHLTLSARPQTLKSNEKGVIVCTYNAAKKNDFGYVTDYVKLLLNGASVANNEIIISASIDENFDAMSEADKANAPVAQFALRSVDLGKVKTGTDVKFSVPVTNNGKNDLIIRKIDGPANIKLTDASEKTAKAGQTINLEFNYHARKIDGVNNTKFTIITNAPRQTNAIIRVSVTEVKKN